MRMLVTSTNSSKADSDFEDRKPSNLCFGEVISIYHLLDIESSIFHDIIHDCQGSSLDFDLQIILLLEIETQIHSSFDRLASCFQRDSLVPPFCLPCSYDLLLVSPGTKEADLAHGAFVNELELLPDSFYGGYEGGLGGDVDYFWIAGMRRRNSWMVERALFDIGV
jgi:hypothetical protein